MSTKEFIDRYLKTILTAVELQPASSSFDVILAKLAKKKRRRLLLILFTGTFALMMCGLFVFYVFFAQHVNTTEQHASESGTMTSATFNPDKVQEQNRSIAETNFTRVATKKTEALKHSFDEMEKTQTMASNDTGKAELKLRANKKVPFTTTESSLSVDQDGDANVQFSTRRSLSSALNSIGSMPDTTETRAVLFEAIPPKIFVFKDTAHVELSIKTLSVNPVTRIQSEDSLVKKKQVFKWLIGVHANPQLTSSLFSENKKRDPLYNNTAEPFSKLYLENRRQQNKFRVNFSLGIKVGFNYKEKWEVWLGGGFQRYGYNEKLYDFRGSYRNLTGPSGVQFSNAPPKSYYENGFTSSLNYFSVAMEVNRIFRPNPFLRLKFGLGVKMNNLQRAEYVYVQAPNQYNYERMGLRGLSRRLYSVQINGGMIRELSNHFQFRLSPGLFYSLSSYFNKSYVIKQRPYGFELEAMLIYRMF